MKQIMVMIAMVILGVALSTMVLGFEAPAKAITDGAVSSITQTLSDTQGKP